MTERAGRLLPALWATSPVELSNRPLLEEIEAPNVWRRPPALFVEDLSGLSIQHSLLVDHPHERHGTCRQPFWDVWLFGHHHFHAVIDAGLRLDCQDIKGCMSRLHYHVAHHPGRHLPIPQIFQDDDIFRVDMEPISAPTTTALEESVYFATPSEPLNWGMWLLQALPAAQDFLVNRPAEKILIYAGRDWQRTLLNSLGIPDDLIVHQELGQTYRCRHIVMRQYSHVDLVPTVADRNLYDCVARDLGIDADGAPSRRLFLSRRQVTRKSDGKYRALLNEEELIDGFRSRGFEIVEPESLPFIEQVRLFRSASLIVGLGGAALFNVVFCKPGTTIISIESSMAFANGHSMLFGSLGHPFGFVFGHQDLTDPSPVHKRWTIDVTGTLAAIDRL